MKKTVTFGVIPIIVIILIVAGIYVHNAKASSTKGIVIDLTQKQTASWTKAVNDIKSLHKKNPNERVVLVAREQGVVSVTKQSPIASQLESEIQDSFVTVDACERAMSAFGIQKSNLVSGVKPVPSGIQTVNDLKSKGYKVQKP